MKSSITSLLRSFPDLFVPLVSGLFLGFSILMVDMNDEGNFVFALFVYLISLVYFFARVIPVIYNRNKPDRKVSVHSVLSIWLSTAFISCFTLNRSMNVFDESVLWYSIFVVCFTTAFTLRSVYNQLSSSTRFLLDVILGMGSLLMLYLIIVLTSWYPIGIMAFLALGISLHVFVPLGIFIFILSALIKRFHEKTFRNPFLVGVSLSVAALLIYGIQWKFTGDKINDIHTQVLFDKTEEQMPMMMEMAQKIPLDNLASKFLKSGIVYNTFENENFWSFGFDRLNFDEPKRHDPLVVICNNLVSHPQISKDERIDLLNFLFRGQHFSERKFWTGEDIHTTKIIYESQLFPEYRLAYTELLMQMAVSRNRKSWTAEQEALYTFYLPEGTAVTSLSLWVNGKEEKSVLTTKSKADSAYSNIVGFQRRDPSVVHWKEGNTITVRVFPVTHETPRQIRIGFTSPLQKIGDKLRYNNIPFQGPDATGADWKIAFSQKGKALPIKSSMKFKDDGSVSVFSGTPDENWYIETDVPALNPEHFNFGGFNYNIQEAKSIQTPIAFSSIVLDINQTWKQKELDAILQLADRNKLYCWNGKEFVQGDAPGFDRLLSERLEYNFSLLPFNMVSDSSHTLIITKGNITGPFLSELKNSDLSKNIKSYFKDGNKPYVFALQGESSVFIKTLAELRLVEYASGNTEKLQTCLAGSFPIVTENDSSIFIPSADVTISKTATTDSIATKAPDHIMRLFAYNKVLRLIGPSYFEESYELEEPVRLASEAHVVSPVSSLIVLETQEDYERFDIKKDKDGLGNAKLKNAGAVPEPHEWVLIVLTIIGIAYYFIRKRKLA